MTGVAALSTAVFVALLVAASTGGVPTLRSTRTDRPPSGLRRALDQAGSTRSPAMVRATATGAAATILVLVWRLSGIAALGLVPAALVLVLPTVLIRRRGLRRLQDIRRAWPDALAQIGGAVRAGRPMSHALVDVSIAGPEALRQPLAGLAARIQTVGVVAALQAAADATDDAVTDRIVEVLCLAHTEGGRLVTEILDDLATGITEEVATAEEVDQLSLEGRLNAKLVFAMPWLVLVLLTSGQGPFRAFYETTAGGLVIAVAGLISLGGVALVGRLAALPDVPRVLRAEGPAR